MIRAWKDAIAGERIEFGSPVRTIDDRAFVEPDLDRAEGIAHRSLISDAVEEGESVRIVTDGDLLALIRGETRWAIVSNGKVKLDD